MSYRKIDQTVTVSDIAKRVNGELIGDGANAVSTLCALDEPIAGGLAFSNSSKWDRLIGHPALNNLSALLINRSLPPCPPEITLSHIRVDNPLMAVSELVPLFFESYNHTGEVSDRAEIHPTATIHPNAHIGAFCSVGADSEIGEGATLYPNVTIYPGVKIGARSVVHAGATVREGCTIGPDSVVQNGAVIGADGFGYIPDPKTGLRPIPQVGSVELGASVEVGANSCIDRATLGTTAVGAGTKLDNLVQIGHNVKIGSHSVVCALAGVAGSSKIGSQVTLGGGAGVADHVEITDGVRLAGWAGATGDIREKGDYGGFPAVPAAEWRRRLAAIRQLPKIIKKLAKR